LLSILWFTKLTRKHSTASFCARFRWKNFTSSKCGLLSHCFSSNKKKFVYPQIFIPKRCPKPKLFIFSSISFVPIIQIICNSKFKTDWHLILLLMDFYFSFFNCCTISNSIPLWHLITISCKLVFSITNSDLLKKRQRKSLYIAKIAIFLSKRATGSKSFQSVLFFFSFSSLLMC
jgi:hypothetical protein